MVNPRDMLGTEIVVGVTVAYPTNSKAKGLVMGVALVTGVVSKDAIRLRKKRDDGSDYHFTFIHLSRSVVAVGEEV